MTTEKPLNVCYIKPRSSEVSIEYQHKRALRVTIYLVSWLDSGADKPTGLPGNRLSIVMKRMPKITQWLHGSVHQQPKTLTTYINSQMVRNLFMHCCKHFKFLFFYKNTLNKVIYLTFSALWLYCTLYCMDETIYELQIHWLTSVCDKNNLYMLCVHKYIYNYWHRQCDFM
jgi:hypothetical protein